MLDIFLEMEISKSIFLSVLVCWNFLSHAVSAGSKDTLVPMGKRIKKDKQSVRLQKL